MQMVDSNLGITGRGISIAIIIVNLLSAPPLLITHRQFVDDHFLRFLSIFSSPFLFLEEEEEEEERREGSIKDDSNDKWIREKFRPSSIGFNWKIFLDDPFQASTTIVAVLRDRLHDAARGRRLRGGQARRRDIKFL